jgi:hypothetical protein
MRRGVTLDELAARTGQPPRLLEPALREEVRAGRVELRRGLYRLRPERFDVGVLEALRAVTPAESDRSRAVPASSRRRHRPIGRGGLRAHELETLARPVSNGYAARMLP